MRLNGKVALVTGAGRGIGRGVAEMFADQGATVIAGDLSVSDPFENSAIEFAELDVTQEESWNRVVSGIVAKHGRIDVLMNNAGGVGSYEPIDSIPLDEWHRIILLNQTSTFFGIRTVVPHMKRQGGGSIINVSSIWGIASAPGVAAYTASKGAVRLMSKNAALSYAEFGIRSNSIHPGIIATPMIAAQDAGITADVVAATPLKRLGTPQEIAYGAVFLASDESSFITGAELVIDGGYTAQ